MKTERRFDLFGIKNGDLKDARMRVEAVLGIRLILHESSYHGGVYYRCGSPGEEEFILKRNYDPIEEEYAEEAFPQHSVLLYVDCTARSEVIKDKLQGCSHGFEHLRSESG